MSRPCANPKCVELFDVTRTAHLYCSERCREASRPKRKRARYMAEYRRRKRAEWTPFSLAEIRANVARQDFDAIPDAVVLALAEVASVAQRRILGEYAPGVALPSSADYEALRLALAPFESCGETDVESRLTGEWARPTRGERA